MEEHKHKKPKKSGVMVWLQLIQIVLLLWIGFNVSDVDESLQKLSGEALEVDEHAEEEEAEEAAPPIEAAPREPTAPAPTVDMEKLIDDDDVKGSDDAPVTIVEFSDYECPFCKRHVEQTYPQIVEKYVDTGKVNYVFRDFPLSFHKNAQKASEAAECAGDQDKYYEMHDLLFAQGVAGGVDSYKGFAGDLGLDQSEFDNCLDSGKHAQEVQQDMRDGASAGVKGTPGFIINGKLVSGAQPYSVFEAAIEEALGN